MRERAGARQSFVHGALVAWFVLARTWQFAAAAPMSFPDSASYLDKAAAPILGSGLFSGDGRLFTVPLLWSPWVGLYGPDPTALTWAQLVLSCVAWLALSSVVGHWMKTPAGRIVARALVLLLGASDGVALWDRTLLSESLSTSLFVGVIATWAWWGHGVAVSGRSSRGAVGVLLLLGVLWGFAREANGLFLAMLALVAAGLAASATGTIRLRTHATAIVAVFLATMVGAQLVAERGERWLFPLLNVVGRRVLPSQDRTAFWVAAGMPLSAPLLEMQGEFASGRNWAFYEAPELSDFRRWIHASGRRTYLRDLVLHPVRSVTEPLAHATEFVCPDLGVYRPDGFVAAVRWSGWAFTCGSRTATGIAVGALLAGAAALLSGWVLRRRLRFDDLFALQTVAILLLAWPVLTWLTWHAIGEMEVGRHVLWATLFLRLGLVLLAARLVDALAGFAARIGAGEAASGPAR